MCEPAFRNALRSAIDRVRKHHPFTVVAWALLPDHLHCIWSLPPDDARFSIRWSLIKRSVSYQLKDSNWVREGGSLWQNRFWEHCIRDEKDLARHFDYIHFNPVKHGLVKEPTDWEWSTFHTYEKLGYYGEGRMPKHVDIKGE